jgi:hypothetical protein
MKNECAFTIVAKNYIGLAQILEGTIKKFNPEVDFYIFVADEFNSEENISLPQNILLAKSVLDVNSDLWVDMSFKYDLTEFCTAIKPLCFKYLFRTMRYAKSVYFDPDIYVFSSLSYVYNLLDKYSILLTPQVNGIHFDYQGELPEWNLFANGVFNMGFCGISNTVESNRMIDWWAKRLEDKCFQDRVYVYFTDQRWMDMLPCFFDSDKLHICRNLGMNLAPWNYFEREVFIEGDEYYVKFRGAEFDIKDKLIFVHFAGYDYNNLKNGIIKRKRITSLVTYKDIDETILIDYRNAIAENKDIFDKCIQFSYTYNFYDNGSHIERTHRRLYHGLCEDGQIVGYPYRTDKGSFYSHLKKQRMIDVSGSLDNINKGNISNISKKKNLIKLLFRTLYFFAGYRRYVLFIRSLITYARFESHVFLLKK